MPAFRNISAVVFLLTAIHYTGFTRAEAETPDAPSAETPRAVVARWLQLHRMGNREEASVLTTGSPYHHADVLLPSKRDTGVRVARSLGNERAAAVVTTTLDNAGDGERVLLFWLVRRDGVWRINKSDTENRCVVDQRLRGFLEAGDVRWDVQRGQLLGRWEAGPCRPPIIGGVACGSRLQLGDDNRYRLAAWGPAGPPSALEGDDVMQGVWRFADDRILMSHQGQTRECRVVWLADNLLVVQSPDGRSRATYKRQDAVSDSDEGQ
jgi:hypothetical protein